MIYYGKQNINQDDIDAVVDVLKSDFLTQGPKVPEFEENLKKYCNVKYAKACSFFFNMLNKCINVKEQHER